MRRFRAFDVAAAAAVAGLLGCAGVATATAAEVDDDDVDVSVTINDNDPGTLALTVAANSVVLEEGGSTATARRFTGTLPTVTVTDTRDVVPVGAAWAVVASSTDFTGDLDQPDIPASYLGWTPAIVTGDPDDFVFAGEPVAGALDGGPGLSDQEMLFTTLDSGETNRGSWSANAQLALTTPATVAPGTYHATMTLSLFE